MISMQKRIESNSLETELFDAFKFKFNSENLSSNEIKIKILSKFNSNSENFSSNEIKILKFSRNDFNVETSRVEFPRN